jgi:hypothetical protein
MKLIQSMTRALRAVALLGACGMTVAFAALAGGPTYTVDINCGQGIVDADHKIEYTLTDPTGNSVGPFTAYVRNSGSEEGAALSTETVLENNGVKDVTRDGSSFTLPKGYSIKEVTVYKRSGKTWKKNDGHLEILNSEGDVISNQ